ncbi:MAG TPA: PKD domain-containing protein [Candidatus Thermoplasmatota archaeon]|nr:PKD domain-containing protein [Candidatus Thermoplasmatota archaeon]
MSRGALSLSLFLAAAALAGCAGEAEPAGPAASLDAAPVGEQAPQQTPAGERARDPPAANTTAPPPAASEQNKPPAVDLVVRPVEDAEEPTFVFVIGATDADGDAMTWSLHFGDDSDAATGSTFPANVTHTFEPGTYNVTLIVSDGKEEVVILETVTAEVVVPEAPGTEYSCTVQMGTAGFVWPGSPAGNLGECTLTEVLMAATFLKESKPASGCVITFDANPDDINAGTPAEAGKTYPAGGQYGMQCSLPSTGGTGSIVIV